MPRLEGSRSIMGESHEYHGYYKRRNDQDIKNTDQIMYIPANRSKNGVFAAARGVRKFKLLRGISPRPSIRTKRTFPASAIGLI